jgi:predicted aldo/keto reductase-like oxidoreductase
MELNRRNFIKLSGVGITGSALIGNFKASASTVTKGNTPRKLIYRTLGRTGIKLPVVSLGAMRADNAGLLKVAMDSGLVHFDTAQGYQQGRNEEMLGAFLKDYKRDSFVIATKIHLRDEVLSKEAFLAKIDESLKRLQMEYIDILYLHAVDKKEFILKPEVIGLLEEAKKSGKVKFVGLSTHRNMVEILKGAIDGKIYDVVLTSYNFKMDNLPELKNAIAEAAKAGIGIVAMKTMAGGYWDKEKTRKINTKAALKWALLDENVHTSIPGCTSFDQLEECISVMEDLQLTEQEKLDLAGDNKTTGLFCLGCEDCIPQCPNHVPVPDIMRSYMYAYGYRDLKLAQEVINNLPSNAKNCNICPVCNVKCRVGFNIQAKAKDILRIQNVPAEFLV